MTGSVPFNALDGASKSDLIKNMCAGTYVIPASLKLSLDCLHFIDKILQFEEVKRITYS